MTQLRIETLGIEIPANRRKGDLYKMEAHVSISDSVLEDIFQLAGERVKTKYPDVLIAPLFSIHISRTQGDNKLTASCKVCIGDGDYVSRVVSIPSMDASFAKEGVCDQ